MVRFPVHKVWQKTILQGTVKGEGRQGRQRKRWEDDYATSFLNFSCSPLPSGTWWTPGLSSPWCCLWCPNDPRGQGIDDEIMIMMIYVIFSASVFIRPPLPLYVSLSVIKFIFIYQVYCEVMIFLALALLISRPFYVHFWNSSHSFWLFVYLTTMLIDLYNKILKVLMNGSFIEVAVSSSFRSTIRWFFLFVFLLMFIHTLLIYVFTE